MRGFSIELLVVPTIFCNFFKRAGQELSRGDETKRADAMTCRKDFTLPAELLAQVSQQGFDILPELIQVIINAAMQAQIGRST